ncbi:4-diphosphocytidyl-2C-methyl-D-erythritol kinase [Lojkania enalia]|uniref:4-(cytidine 5'-diphospho)-2-C-methyl-D-erythritol kinase n=1 Tax=Lojkania enalia TaxID=147567 RepID=A0A9P4JYP1_9PLEO|nr:4-diphosphocytidyl-2C-methyl-D-erythritol kinase [Didymosphaeria enalia]
MEDESITLRIPSKINIYLQAGLAREDGYHDITTVYQAISLYDELRITLGKPRSGLSITVSGEDTEKIPTDSRNLAVKAAMLLASRTGIQPNLRFHLSKFIPTEAGLSGGSADAAAALLGCSLLWKLGLDESCLREIGAEIGEDVPFFIGGSMAIGTGHKKPLLFLTARMGAWYWVLGIPRAGLPTKDVFIKFDEITNGEFDSEEYKRRHEKCLQTAWGTMLPALVAKFLSNDLESAATTLLPDIKLALEVGRRRDALASVMTGSGSTCAFLASDSEHTAKLVFALQKTNIFRRIIVANGPVAGVHVIEDLTSQ